MIIHELIQGNDDWDTFRLTHKGASEAAAALGLSKKVKRNELLYMKKTGTAKEFTAWVQEHILDHGHEVEAMARPMAASIAGKTFYPVTCSLDDMGDNKSASCDGLTMAEDVAFEHKQWNAELAASISAGELPEEHAPQCHQVLMVTCAEKLLFMVSNGTPEQMVWMWVYPDPVWFERINAGWVQFDIDLENYQHVEILPAAIASPVLALPSLSIIVSGTPSIQSNLVPFGDRLTAFIEGIVMEPSTDQDFADAAAAVAILQKAQDSLAQAESSALSQTASIDEMRGLVKMYFDLARNTRLQLEKIVEARKKTIRIEIQQEANNKVGEHIDSLNQKIGKTYMPKIPVDFASAMKSKKTIASLRDAVDTELANFKIKADAVFKTIMFNITTLRELAPEHHFLFADTAQIVLKANEDFTSLIKVRIAEHKETEAKRLEIERVKMAEEARITAEANNAALIKAAAEKLAAEQAKKAKVLQDEADSLAREQEARAKALKDATDAPVPILAQKGAERLLNPSPVYPFPKAVETPAARPTDAEILLVLAIHFKITSPQAMELVRGMDIFNSRPAITLERVESSQIYAIGHDAVENVLAVQFKNRDGGPGSVYNYKHFDEGQYQAFKNAESIGTHFGKEIKNAADRHPFLKVG